MPHTLFESSRITPVDAFAGTLVGASYNGTSQGTVRANDYEYNAFVYTGTVANTGTAFLYAIGAGQTNGLIGSFIFGSIAGNASLVWEVKSDTLTGIGTLFTHLGMNLAVDTGGTLRGAGAWLQTWPKTSGTVPLANGWGSVGTTLF